MTKNKTKKTKKEAKPIVKRGRGRPPKAKSIVKPLVKRGRGRPRKNPLPIETVETVEKVEKVKVVKPVDATIPRKRGRPKKNSNFNAPMNEDNVQPLVPLKVGKLVGYCPSCNAIISTLDHISAIDAADKRPDVYFCYHCAKELNQSELLTTPPKSEPKYRSKKEYLEDCLKVADDSHIPARTTETVEETFSDLSPHPDILSGE